MKSVLKFAIATLSVCWTLVEIVTFAYSDDGAELEQIRAELAALKPQVENIQVGRSADPNVFQISLDGEPNHLCSAEEGFVLGELLSRSQELVKTKTISEDSIRESKEIPLSVLSKVVNLNENLASKSEIITAGLGEQTMEHPIKVKYFVITDHDVNPDCLGSSTMSSVCLEQNFVATAL